MCLSSVEIQLPAFGLRLSLSSSQRNNKQQIDKHITYCNRCFCCGHFQSPEGAFFVSSLPKDGKTLGSLREPLAYRDQQYLNCDRYTISDSCLN
ncbi:uncharacterized protein Dmoj_GI25997 [Drosophila mojavensis]|uniref:Uncharacterized protein n=1 Tax=Drosophila mojavensis TaxID=7230 RepID=A0A0Q9WZE3_DROMO|nr:uncharacterized protein Dmoj_GI25997 [Drosophila mojavensis]